MRIQKEFTKRIHVHVFGDSVKCYKIAHCYHVCSPSWKKPCNLMTMFKTDVFHVCFMHDATVNCNIHELFHARYIKHFSIEIINLLCISMHFTATKLP